MAPPAPSNPPWGPSPEPHHAASTPAPNCKHPLSSQENITQSQHPKERSSTEASSLGKGRREVDSAQSLCSGQCTCMEESTGNLSPRP